ncbi:MAG: biopolymer transporter ExbD [Bacteroidetes bacterium]|jgi:biopolymer transport protein ExbD|nr:biopolymer transporter ExbD [Bacteroidota bacterium]
MKIKRRHKEAAEVSTESLNDIMFFLLLFFLIISTLVNPSVMKLALPNSKSAVQMTLQPVTVEVNADHEYAVNKTKIAFSDLENALRFAISKQTTPTVVLKLDKSLTVQDLADVMQIGYNLGVKMVLSTKATDK